MSYLDVIQRNCEGESPVAWWPKFAFHYTDVMNAVSILDSGILYSRSNAKQLGLMRNDNASRQVIDMTQTEAISCVRFYFRPLTPTQYYNEGFKHSQLRYFNDENANTPVPVFFLFNLDKLLSIPEVKFSEQSQSGHGAQVLQGEQSFANLDFKRIYSNGFESFEQNKKYRHAEILHPNAMSIDHCLNTILCRNALERVTLLNMLREKNQHAFIKYQGIVKISKSEVFENNGLFVTDCRYHDNTISIVFSDYYSKKQYTQRMMNQNHIETLKPVTIKLVLDWWNARSVVHHNVTETQIDYQLTTGIMFKGVPSIPNAKTIRVQVFIEGKLMSYIEQSLAGAELIK